MTQIELQEQHLKRVDELIKEGLFLNRNQAILAGLESLLELPKEEIQKIEEAKYEVDMFLEDNVGDMLYASTPVKVVIDGKEMYKVPVKSFSDKTSQFFYLYINPTTMEVDVNFLTDSRSLPEMPNEELENIRRVQEEANDYCKNNFNMLAAGIPLKDALEVEEGFKECFRIPLISQHKSAICGYLFFDVKTLSVLDCMIFKRYAEI